MNINALLYYLREYFFPNGCGGCGEALQTAEDAKYGLCGKCRVTLEYAFEEGKRCIYCGKQLISEMNTCLLCRKNGVDETGQFSEHLVRIRTFFPYSGKYKRVLAAYKFRESLGVGNFLAGFFPRAIEKLGVSMVRDSAWVPVPPRPGKLRKQGWDQIEFLAKQLETRHNQNVRRCLKRLPSRSQKELNRDERGSNLKGRILCVKPPPRTVILFDDVITTGATLDACAKALLDGGAENVYGVCLFYD